MKSGMARAFLHGQHPDRDTLLRESLLPLLSQDGESTHFNEAVEDVQVSNHTTIQTIQDTALPGYIVLENDNTIILQAILAPDKKLQEIFIRQISYRWKDGKQITINHLNSHFTYQNDALFWVSISYLLQEKF